jgi:hypothetical protein
MECRRIGITPLPHAILLFELKTLSKLLYHGIVSEIFTEWL